MTQFRVLLLVFLQKWQKSYFLWSISCKDGCSSDTWAVAARWICKFIFRCSPDWCTNSYSVLSNLRIILGFKSNFFPSNMYSFWTLHNNDASLLSIFRVFISPLDCVFHDLSRNPTGACHLLYHASVWWLVLDSEMQSHHWHSWLFPINSHMSTGDTDFSHAIWLCDSDWWIDLSTGNSDVIVTLSQENNMQNVNENGTCDLNTLCHNIHLFAHFMDVKCDIY